MLIQVASNKLNYRTHGVRIGAMNFRIFIFVFLFMGVALSGLAEAGQSPVSLTLRDALQKAKTLNLQVMMANARLEGAIARISEAQAALMPGRSNGSSV